MTKYFTQWDDFDVDTIGTNVVGWTVRGSTVDRKPAYGSAAQIPIKRRYVSINSTVGGFSAISQDVIDADANRANCNIVTCVPIDLCTTDNIYIVGRGQGAVTDGNYLQIVKSTNQLLIAKRAAGVSNNLASTSFTYAAGHSYFFRLDMQGATVRCKAWDAALGMAGEPAAWTLTGTTTVTAAGWAGFALFNLTATTEAAAFNFFAAATNGDTAICPLTNAEYTAWLGKQDVMRAVVAKMRATGYDSSGSPYTAVRKVYLANHGYTSQQQDSPSLQHFDNAITGIPTFAREMPAALSGQATVNFGRLRVANPAKEVAGAAYLLLDGASGGYASTPDSAVNSIVGDIDIRVDVEAADWTPTAAYNLVAKRQSTGQASFRLGITTGGNLFFEASANGTTFSLGGTSTATTGFSDNSRHWARVTRVSATGSLNFYTSADGVAWTQLGTTLAATAGAIFDSTSIIEIGSVLGGTAERAAGKIYRAQIYNGIAGTLAVDFNLTNVVKGTTSFSGPTGEVWTINGTARIRQEVDTLPGLRDDWLRIHWLRDGFELLMGAPSWPLHDFRHIVRGRLGNPIAPDLKTLEFPIADMSEFFNRPMTATRFTAGNGPDYVDQIKPVLYGQVRAIEPPMVDLANNLFQIGERSIVVSYLTYPLVSDNNIPLLVQGKTITAVDTATDTLTLSSSHGMVVNYTVILWFGDSFPAPLNDTTVYYVVAVPAANQIRLSLTRGGAAINLTTATTGGRLTGYGYDFPNNGIDGTVRLAAARTPGGRVFVSDAYSDIQAIGPTPTGIYGEMIFTGGGLSLNYKDQASFDALNSLHAASFASSYWAGIWFPVGQRSLADGLVRHAKGTATWYSVAPDGLVQVGQYGLPAATASQEFYAGNCKDVRMVDSIRPIDYSINEFAYAPWASTPFQASVNVGISAYGESEILQGKKVLAAYSYGAASTPLDNFPTSADPNINSPFSANFVASANAIVLRAKLAALFQTNLGIFEFDTTLPAMERSIGETVSLDFPRLGWKQFSATDPASPDNTATIDARLAVIIGINVNIAEKSPFKVRLKVFRRIPGYFPIANLN